MTLITELLEIPTSCDTRLVDFAVNGHTGSVFELLYQAFDDVTMTDFLAN